MIRFYGRVVFDMCHEEDVYVWAPNINEYLFAVFFIKYLCPEVEFVWLLVEQLLWQGSIKIVLGSYCSTFTKFYVDSYPPMSSITLDAFLGCCLTCVAFYVSIQMHAKNDRKKIFYYGLVVYKLFLLIPAFFSQPSFQFVSLESLSVLISSAGLLTAFIFLHRYRSGETGYYNVFVASCIYTFIQIVSYCYLFSVLPIEDKLKTLSHGFITIGLGLIGYSYALIANMIYP